MSTEAEVEAQEERLRHAMLAGDIAELDRLLGDRVVYTDHNGARFDKESDIALHRSGLLRVERIDPLAPPLIRVLGDSAVVSVSLNLAGSYAGQPFGGAFAYTRLWHRSNGEWRVEAAHSSAIVLDEMTPR